MTRLRRTNLANALFYLPRPALVLVPIFLKGLTVIVTLGVAVWLESTWIDLFLAGVMGYTLLRWNALTLCPGWGGAADAGGDLVPENHGDPGGPHFGGGFGTALSAAALRGLPY